MQIKKGQTRWTILIFNLAFKIPSLKSWGRFVNGLLNNMYENTHPHPGVCPIIFKIPGGFVNVMPRCTPADELDYNRLAWMVEGEEIEIPPYVELKSSSFGYLSNGRLVALDWARY